MKEVHEGLFVGNESDCVGRSGVRVVHACKVPCHRDAVGYSGSLAPGHPNYLSLERKHNLFLNMVDPPIPLFKLDSFKLFRDFARREYTEAKRLLIHCNEGFSRAPSLALLFLARDLGVINAESYASARAEFEKLYPPYKPGEGIAWFMRSMWDQL